jgi:hypothetical protein
MDQRLRDLWIRQAAVSAPPRGIIAAQRLENLENRAHNAPYTSRFPSRHSRDRLSLLAVLVVAAIFIDGYMRSRFE